MSGSSRSLRGVIHVPGDKSIGHRACMLAGLAEGVSSVRGLSGGADNHSTMSVLEGLGVRVERDFDGPGTARVHGAGLRGLRADGAVLDCGNSGTTMRLMMGVLAGQTHVRCTLDGDASLRRRPMARVSAPLAGFGARIDLPHGDHPPVQIRGGGLVGAEVETRVASAQVKSACLLAAINADGPSTVRENAPTRDHTERMLRALGVPITVSAPGEVRISPPARGWEARDWRVPGDPSSAAFWVAAATLVPGSEVAIEGVCLNPTRTGFLDIVRAMGGDVAVEDVSSPDGEPVGRLVVRGARLTGIAVEGDVVVRAIDEMPLLAVLAATAEGETTVRGAAELRVKESDRVAAMAEGLGALGAAIEARPDGWRIEGREALSGGAVRTFGDHRIAMALGIAGLTTRGAVELDDPDCVAVSYPGFFDRLAALSGAAA
jgi:3-phosphoshikimate 1-carboxyvinyltransferase